MIRYQPHYTLAEYQQWEGDWELWNGNPVAMTPSSFGIHQYIAANLIHELKLSLEHLESGAVVLHEIDWIVSDDMVVRPDIVICEEVPKRHLERAPLLAVEILSPSTADKDKKAKRDLYQEQGVHCYLIVDTDAKSIEGFVLNDHDTYETLRAGDRIAIPLAEKGSIEMSMAKVFA